MKWMKWAAMFVLGFSETAYAQFSDTTGKAVIGIWMMSSSDSSAGYGSQVLFCVNRMAGPGIFLNPQKVSEFAPPMGEAMGGPCNTSGKSKAICLNEKNRDRWDCSVNPQGIAACTVYFGTGKVKMTTAGPRIQGEC